MKHIRVKFEGRLTSTTPNMPTAPIKNPLPCGCGAVGTPGLNNLGTRMKFTGIHVKHCPLHAAAPALLAALKEVRELRLSTDSWSLRQRAAARRGRVWDAVDAAISQAELAEKSASRLTHGA